MALLIDGYNLLHATDIFGAPGPGTALQRSRAALLEFLVASLTKRDRAQTTIVFDAAGAPPGLPHTMKHEAITIRFSRAYDEADVLLEELIEQCRSPRTLTVVSGDHRVQRAARRRGAKYVDSGPWFAQLRARGRIGRSHDAPSTKKPLHPTPEEVEDWLKKFSEPLPADDPHRRKKRPPKAPPKPARGAARERPSKKRSGRQSNRKDPNSEKAIFGEGIDPFPPGYADDLLEEE